MILSIGPLCLAGWAMVLYSKSMESLTFVRILHGLATGVVRTVTPVYTAEIAEPRLRGRLARTFHAAWFGGVLFSFCLGPYLSYDTFVYVCFPLPIIFTIVIMFLPETPYYLLMTERDDEARKVLGWLRDSNDVEEELAEMLAAVREGASRKGSSWSALFGDKTERKAFVMVQIVCITEFLTGIPVIVNYALDTYSKSDSFLPPEEMSMLLGGLLTGIAVLSLFLPERVGRKPLLLLSCFGCSASHLLTGAYFFLHEKTDVDAAPFVWMMYLGLAMYCFFFDIGVGSLLQTFQTEMFGARTRGLAVGLTEGLAAVLCFVALKAYSPVNEMFGVYINFWFYSAVGLVGGLAFFWLKYETAGQLEAKLPKKQIF